MDIKVFKDKHISRWVDTENTIYVRWNRVKNMYKVICRGEKEVKHWTKQSLLKT